MPLAVGGKKVREVVLALFHVVNSHVPVYLTVGKLLLLKRKTIRKRSWRSERIGGSIPRFGPVDGSKVNTEVHRIVYFLRKIEWWRTPAWYIVIGTPHLSFTKYSQHRCDRYQHDCGFGQQDERIRDKDSHFCVLFFRIFGDVRVCQWWYRHQLRPFQKQKQGKRFHVVVC